MWGTISYPSLKSLGDWIVDLQQRIKFMRSWLEKGQPQSFWLPGFFFPQGIYKNQYDFNIRLN